MDVINLNGEWSLTFSRRKSGEGGKLKAVVPGNVEFDLQRAGLLPQDLFMGLNIEKAYPFEGCDWIFERVFDCPHPQKTYRMYFGGVDCVADYYVNGEKIGHSENMLVEHVFPVVGLKEKGNTLKVVIFSSFYESQHKDYPLRLLTTLWAPSPTKTNTWLRRAQHTYGWDIMPRAVSAGIWKDVRLEEIDPAEIKQFYVTTRRADDGCADLFICYEISSDVEIDVTGGYFLEIEAYCGTSGFKVKKQLFFRAGNLSVMLKKPLLWYPKGYGKQPLYETTARLFKGGRLLSEKKTRFGIRTAELLYSEWTDGKNGDFRFRINGRDIFVCGTNWVPLSPYHSQDKGRLPRALGLLDESGCNLVRCWGGNVYESDEFFDFADEKGILVWQDFAFACAAYPDDGEFLREVEREAEKVIKRLRQHPALVLWAGDNELDTMYAEIGLSGEENAINRRVLPRCVHNFDLGRPYLPSSPYLSEEAAKRGGDAACAEQHLWGAREYFKSDFYAATKAHFVSEIGYHGCVDEESAKKFIPPEDLENRYSDSWKLHSTDFGKGDARIRLMERQISIYFGEVPNKLAEFSKASQLVQAEAYKFFIEMMRSDSDKHGIVWWNLLDGWPQFADSVVDFYYRKKLAFDVIRRAQSPVLLFIRENENTMYEIMAVNDTSDSKSIDYFVTDERGEPLVKGKTTLSPGQKKVLGILSYSCSEKKLLLLRWTGDSAGVNHFITGFPPYDPEQTSEWYRTIDDFEKKLNR